MGDTIAQTRVLDLEKTKTTQQNEIARLKRRVKKFEQKKRSRTHGLKRLHKVGMSRRVESSGDEEDFDYADNEMFDVNALNDEEVFVAEQEVANEKDDDGEITLAQALIEMKSIKPKVKGDVIKESNVPVKAVSAPTKISAATTTTTIIPTPRKGIVITELDTPTITRSSQQPSQAKVQDKGKGKMRLMKRKELPEQRRKHFAAKRGEEKRNKLPTKTQQKKTMITYLKNMEGWKHKDLKSKDFDSIKKLFDKAFKRVNMFVDFRTDLVEGSSKRAGEELEQESTKKQKVDDDKETSELKQCLEIISDEEEVTIDAIPLDVKSPSIVDWKIYKEGKKSYYQIVRADGKSQMYMIFSHMLKSFDREDLEDLYKLVKARYGSTRPVEDLDLVLWNDLKNMFEPHIEDVGRIVGIKSFLMLFEVTAALIDVTTAYTKLLLLEEVTTASGRVNAAGEEKNTSCGKGVTTVMPITSAEDKAQRRLEVKARKKRFGRNATTKKTQRNLLKQQYENFTAPSSDMLDQTFNRLQKVVSQLVILDEKISQEDVNQKLLRSLSPEWKTHAVVWRINGETLAFVSSSNNNTNSTNEAFNTAHGVSTVSTQVNAVNFTNIDNLSDVVIC
ncbi:hypothetical protein Tco_0960445 [Tanacetum coccineum]